MKKIFLFAFVVLSALISCKKDGDAVQNPPVSNLAVTLLSSNRAVNNNIVISWKADNETGVQQYQLERSLNTVNFTSLTTVSPTGNTGGTVTYSKNDVTPLNLSSYYRIKATLNNGEIKYSNVFNSTCALKSENIIGTYKITAATYRPNATAPEVDIFATWNPCEKDDLYLFDFNNVQIFQDAGIQCVPPANGVSTWAFTAPNTLSLGGQPTIVTVFTCTNFTWTLSGVGGSLQTTVFTRQ